MKSKTKTIVEVSAGWALILVGIIGWLLPIMPGWPFFIMGVIILDLAIFDRQLHWLIKKFPKLAEQPTIKKWREKNKYESNT
jgi:uncharacterized membrane protein YbaN (DUF454 family)